MTLQAPRKIARLKFLYQLWTSEFLLDLPLHLRHTSRGARYSRGTLRYKEIKLEKVISETFLATFRGIATKKVRKMVAFEELPTFSPVYHPEPGTLKSPIMKMFYLPGCEVF